MHLRAKEHFFQPTSSGGLGLRNTGIVNQSLLAKQLWRILSAPSSSLLGSTLQVKYMDISSNNIFKQPYNSSWIWKGILNSKAIILDHLKWSVGNGLSIPINHHLWWPMQSGSHSQDSYLRVADLLLHSVEFLTCSLPLFSS